MLDASGRYRINYADVLRALGNYLDTQSFRDLTLVETPDGFLVKGRVMESSMRATGSKPQTYLFANDDLDALIEEAYQRRGSGAPPAKPGGADEVRYEDRLRAIGYKIDAEGWNDIVIIQVPGGTRLRALAREQGAAGAALQVIDLLLTEDEIERLLRDLRGGRRSKSGRKFPWPF